LQSKDFCSKRVREDICLPGAPANISAERAVIAGAFIVERTRGDVLTTDSDI
jgi:hypothetical protein